MLYYTLLESTKRGDCYSIYKWSIITKNCYIITKNCYIITYAKLFEGKNKILANKACFRSFYC